MDTSTFAVMSPQRSANWKKRQAELLFDDFIKIKRRTGSFSKNEGASFEGTNFSSYLSIAVWKVTGDVGNMNYFWKSRPRKETFELI